MIAACILCATLAACQGSAAGSQSLSPPVLEGPTCHDNELSARTHWANATAPSREIGEQCLMRGLLAISSSKTVVQAISEFHCALTFYPERAAEAHRGLGDAYMKIDGVLKAIEHYSKYLELKPQANDRSKVEVTIQQLKRASNGKNL